MVHQKRKTTRRQFLQGRAAVEAFSERLATAPAFVQQTGVTPAKAPDVRAADETYLVKIERWAMACNFAVFLNAGQHPHAAELAVEALDLLEHLEEQMSVYRENSQISLVNRLAAEKSVPVEPPLFGLLERATELWRETDGAFDITAGPLSKVWGFYRRQGELPDRAKLEQAMASVGTQWLELDKDDLSVRFLRPGLELNLGAIGKGYALDRCAEILLAGGVNDFLVHGGLSSALARGTRARGAAERAGWSAGVRHALRADRRLAELRLEDRGLGTSGSGTQFFHHKGNRYGHILDPRTGQPALGVLSATAIAPSAADADALATAFYVMGLEKTGQYCERHPEVAALLVSSGPKPGRVRVDTFNLPEEKWTCLGED